MASAVCIDIGSRSLKILRLENSSGKFKTTHFFPLELPPGSDYNKNPDLLTEPIKEIFKSHNLDRNNVVLSLPSQDCILREITVDFEQDEHIRKIIKYEAEKYLHSYPIEDVIIDYQKLSVTNGKSKLFVVAVPKKIIKQRLEILEKCDIDPLIIDLDASSLVNIVPFCAHLSQKKTVVLIDFGASSTRMVIASDGCIRHVRATRLGANVLEEISETSEEKISGEEQEKAEKENIDLDISNQLIVSLPAPDGINLGREVLIGSEETAQREKMQEVFDRLMREIRRTLLTLKVDSPIELLGITGGGSQLEGLPLYLRDKLRVETEIMSFSENIPYEGTSREEYVYSSAIALGGAVRALGKGTTGMDFRKEEFAYTNRFEIVKIPLSFLITIIFLVSLVLAYHVQNYRIKQEKYLKNLSNQAHEIYERSTGKVVKSSGSKAILKMRREMGLILDPDEELPEIPDGFERWRILFEAFQQARSRGYNIIIKTFTLDQRTCIIQGNLMQGQDAALDFIRQELSKLTKIVNAETININNQKSGDPRYPKLEREYTIEFSFKEKGEDEDE